MNFQKQAFMAKDLKVHNIRMDSENGEEGGDSGELVPGRSIRFTGINLTQKQFCELIGHDAAAEFFYDFSNGSKGEPAHENISTIWLDQVYKGCKGAVIFGTSKTEVEFEDARVKNMSIKVKGKARFGELALTLVAVLPEKVDTLRMERYFGKVVGLKLAFGDIEEDAAKEQKQLELEGGGKAGDEENEEGKDSDDGRNGRQRAPVSDEQRTH